MKKVVVFTTCEKEATISDILISAGYEVLMYSDQDTCIQSVCRGEYMGFFVDIIDQFQEGADCLTLCADIKKINPQFPVILLIPEGYVSIAVKAAKLGIQHIFEKPLPQKDIATIFDIIVPAKKSKQIPFNERLTANERRIVEQIFKGYTNKEISKLLGRSVRTIEEHRASIMRKLDVDNTVDLLNRSLQIGIVSPDDIVPPKNPVPENT